MLVETMQRQVTVGGDIGRLMREAGAGGGSRTLGSYHFINVIITT